MSRIDMPEKERKDFCLYVDEFQNFATDSFATILSEARKYRLNLVLAHQYIGQLVTDTSTRVRDAIFGNVGTIITFRVGAPDAEFLEKEFAPEFTANDLVGLGFANIYLKLLIDGFASRPFSATTLPPIAHPEKSYRDKIIKLSRERFGTPREIVEEKIAKWSEAVKEEQKAKEKEDMPGFETVCWDCGQKTKVNFEPDRVRPVYCRDCLKKAMSEKAGGAPATAPVRPFAPRNPINRAPIARRPRSFVQRSDYRTEPAKSLSLGEALKKEPINFSKKKKAVDLGGLRKTIDEAVKKEDY
jgi:CxxC-x17-CxxC domain-containing protein